MKILRTIGILALVAGLVLGGTGSALAQGPPDGPPGGGPHSPKHGLFGTVLSPVETIIEGEKYVISLETKEQGTFDITADDTAKYMVPRETHGPQDLATFLGIVDLNTDDNLEELEGRRLAVLVTNLVEVNTEEFTADAIRLMLIPSPDAPPFQMHHRYMHRVGVVEDFTPGTDGSITIIDKDGESHTFTVSEDTVYRPSAEDDGISELTGTDLIDAITGGCVTVVTTGDPKLGPIAKAIVLHDELPDWAPS